MLIVNFTAWKSTYILATLIVLSIVFAFLMPQTQESKNIRLYEAVIENNVTKARIMIDKGAKRNILLPSGYPLLSLAIEYENEAMMDLLMLDAANLSRTYKGYRFIEHAAKKKNKKLLDKIIEALEKG